jgi:mannose-1-phosphate guanylyltransferase
MNWAVVLAGGNGARLRSLTRELTGDDRPKQFCPLLGGRTLLAETRSRIALTVHPARTLCVVTRDHEAYYRRELVDLTPPQLIEQPDNRGTALAIAYGLSRVGRHDSKAVVGYFPADHYYEDVTTFSRAVSAGYAAARRFPDRVFLLGTEPDSPETEYGWIEPGLSLAGPTDPLFHVARFWEKPAASLASDLLARGCLWNMFVMIGTLDAFRALLTLATPDLARSFERIEQVPATEKLIDRIYGSLPPVDFSADVIATRPDRVAVVRLPNIGWTDLGQPARVRLLLTRRTAEATDALAS